MIEFYTLEYAPPAFDGPKTGGIVKFDRFFSARSYEGTAMLYKPAAYKVVAYNYHRWRTSPGDMVTDYLVRDFRHSGLFRAVFSYRQPESARFLVGGGVEEFVEAKEAGGWNAVLGLYVTVLDLKESDVTEKVVFQKKYRVVQPINGESPESFATGMSEAMARASVQIVGDVRAAVKDRKPRD
jgi:cholesterol transport system auxiliary component